MKKLFCKLLLAASFLTPLFTNKVQAMGSGPFEGLKDFAKSVTLGIETPASSGSGILIGKKGDIYFFLTAAHVAISDPQKEEFWAYSVAGGQTKQYQITSFEKPDIFADKDIVIGSFVSKENLPISLIFPLNKEKGIEETAFGTSENKDKFTSPSQWILDGRDWPLVPQELKSTWMVWKSINGRSYDETWDIQGPPLVAGVSIPTKAIPVALMRSSAAQMQVRVPGNQKGYEAIYAATSTVPGMSGGGIYAARNCPDLIVKQNADRQWREPLALYPGVIGMHGMSESYGMSGGRSGTSLGIPLEIFSDFFTQNASRYGIPTGQSYKDKVIDLCVNKSFW